VSLPPEDCCESYRLTEEQATGYELKQPAEIMEGLPLEAVIITVYDCCILAYIYGLELINADIR
jgi:hypothetical protein